MRHVIKHFKIELLLVVVSLLAVAWLQFPRLGDELRVDEDFRSFYWMNKFQDPKLFPDYFQGYTEIHLPWGSVPVNFKSLGYGLLFYSTSFLVSPIFFSKLLPFLLMPITVLYLFKFGKLFGGQNTGIALALGFLFFNLASSSAISIANGLQRSFAATLIIVLLYYLQSYKFIPATVVIVLSALIYPPMFALAVMIWGIAVLAKSWHTRTISLKHAGFSFLILSFCLGALILSPVLFENIGNGGAGESAQMTQVRAPAGSEAAGKYFWDDPQYQLGGAAPLFIIFPLVGRGGIVDLGEDLINLLIFVILGGLIILVRGCKAFNLPSTVWYMMWATIILFVLAWLAIGLTGSTKLLYWPSRYTRVGLFLFSLMFVCLNLGSFFKEAPLVLRNKPRQLVWLIAGIEIFIVVLVVGYPSEWATIHGFNMKWLLILAGVLCGFLGFLIYRMPQHSTSNRVTSKTRSSFAFRILIIASGLIFLLGWAIYAPIFTEVSYLNPPPSQRALFQFLQALPKDTLIAGTPCALDSVPLFARRTALFSCEFEKSATVIPEALNAYYTDNPRVIMDFCRTYQIDYLVVDSAAYSGEYVRQGQMFFKPYNHQLLSRIGDRDQFALAEVPDEEKLFQAENYFVVHCDDLGALK